MYIYNTEIHPSANGAEVIPNGYVRIENGRIAAVGRGMPDRLSLNSDDIDAVGLRLYPGFIDIHTHMGLIGDGQGAEGEDVNEDSDPVTPHLRTIEGLC